MDLEKELTCSICTDILYQPLTLLDCLHTFCGACLKEWFSWQALAAETSPNPPQPGAPIFTCPSCRDAVRSTKHNATVVTLLDMLMTTQPDKRKPENEKAEMDSKYRPGDNVLPKVRIPTRTAEQQRIESAEQRLIDEVREISRREAVAAAESAEDSSGSAPSAREARRRQRATSSRTGTGSSEEDARRRRVANESIPRIMGHQSSLRSLISNSQDISSSSGAALDIEQEIAAFARQIEEEGILDGLDLDNIDINNDDELNRRIAEAFERRQRGRTRQNNTGRNEGSRRDVSRHDGSRHDGNTNNRHRASSAVSHHSQASGSGSTPAAASRPDASPARPTLSVAATSTASRPPSSSARPSSRRRSQSQSSHRSRSSTGGARLQVPAATDSTPSTATLTVPTSNSASATRPQIATSSSHHLEVRDDSRRHHQRRRTASEGRSTSLPVSTLDTSAGRSGAHSQADLALRPAELSGSSVLPVELPSPPPPVLPPSASRVAQRQTEGRTSSFPTPSPSSSSSSLQSNQNSSPTAGAAASFQARALAMGLPTLPNQSNSFPVSRAPESPTTSDGGRTRVKRAPTNPEPSPMVAAQLAMSPVVAETHELPAFTSQTPHQQQQERSWNRRQGSTVYSEPDINCSKCARKRIQYTVHYNCSTCSNGNWNLCQGCYRAGKGCQHWFGFGYSAQSKWEKRAAQWRSENPGAAANGVPFPPMHTLTANRYLAPRHGPVSIDGTTTDDPQARLQSGVFCARCNAWANSCFWRCDTCNEGDWGFCNDCVNQGFSCTHQLLPLTYLSQHKEPAIPQYDQHQHPHLPTPPPRPQASALFQPPGTPAEALSPSLPRTGPFRPLSFSTTCDICRKSIPPNNPRFHCYSCKSNVVPDTLPGDYDICQGCYDLLIVAQPPSPDGSVGSRPVVTPENGPNGWRRCPSGGHRMVVVAFYEDRKGGVPRRVILEDLVGGYRLETEKVPPTTAAAIEANKRGVDLESWYVWYAEKKMYERHVSRDVRMSAGIFSSPSNEASSPSGAVMTASAAAAAAVVSQPFPPLGGVGYTATARWAYYPEPSSSDEATVDDELSFPRHAEIREVEDVNGEWFHGVYMGRKGLFPSGFVRIVQHGR